MTHDYKEIWEEFVKRNGEQGFFAEAIRSALQLAQEAEQLRKERDELARYIVDQNKALNWHDLQCIKGVNYKAELLAKKVKENGNA